MKYFFVILTSVLFLSCISNNEIEVQSVGSFESIINDLQSAEKIDFSEFQEKQNFYALGAVENLKGEIIVFDSKPFFVYRSNSDLENQEITIKNTFAINAVYAVNTTVNNWKDLEIPSAVKTKKELQNFIFKNAKTRGIDVSKPFPFLIEGLVSSISWFVIDWPTDETKESGKKSYEIGYNETSLYENVRILGFYKDGHMNPFSDTKSNLQMHFINAKETKAGHVNNLLIGDNMVLKLPK